MTLYFEMCVPEFVNVEENLQMALQDEFLVFKRHCADAMGAVNTKHIILSSLS